MTINERVCPHCGLKMMQLSSQLWQCKCGYKLQGEADADKEGKEAPTRGRRLGGTRDARFREQKQSAHKGLRHA